MNQKKDLLEIETYDQYLVAMQDEETCAEAAISAAMLKDLRDSHGSDVGALGTRMIEFWDHYRQGQEN